MEPTTYTPAILLALSLLIGFGWPRIGFLMAFALLVFFTNVDKVNDFLASLLVTA